MDNPRLQWLKAKFQDPKFPEILLDRLERAKTQATIEHERNEREAPLDKIRLSRGKLDGVNKIFEVLDGIRASEKKNPPEPGLMARILKFGEKNGP